MTLPALVGRWEGTGTVDYPTIDPFTYREVLEVREREGLFHYELSTWLTDGAEEVPSHQETGFIRIGDDGTVDMLNAQGSDRVEVLRGKAATEEDVLVLELESVAIAGDDRMIRSWRSLELEGDELRYTMGMATTRVPDGALHLTARLSRV